MSAHMSKKHVNTHDSTNVDTYVDTYVDTHVFVAGQAAEETKESLTTECEKERRLRESCLQELLTT